MDAFEERCLTYFKHGNDRPLSRKDILPDRWEGARPDKSPASQYFRHNMKGWTLLLLRI